MLFVVGISPQNREHIMEAIIEILKKEGKDVSKIEDQYKIAELELTRAKAGVVVASTLSVKQIMSSTSKGVIRDLVKETEDTIKNAGEAYKKTLDALKPLAEPTTSTATTTSN